MAKMCLLCGASGIRDYKAHEKTAAHLRAGTGMWDELIALELKEPARTPQEVAARLQELGADADDPAESPLSGAALVAAVHRMKDLVPPEHWGKQGDDQLRRILRRAQRGEPVLLHLIGRREACWQAALAAEGDAAESTS